MTVQISRTIIWMELRRHPGQSGAPHKQWHSLLHWKVSCRALKDCKASCDFEDEGTHMSANRCSRVFNARPCRDMDDLREASYAQRRLTSIVCGRYASTHVVQGVLYVIIHE